MKSIIKVKNCDRKKVVCPFDEWVCEYRDKKLSKTKSNQKKKKSTTPPPPEKEQQTTK